LLNDLVKKFGAFKYDFIREVIGWMMKFGLINSRAQSKERPFEMVGEMSKIFRPAKRQW
jgi:hypothetical protein